nr:RHS repeat-associated core domain-containing protein [Paenibacillus riograndensis]
MLLQAAALAAGPQVLESNRWDASNRLIKNTNTYGDITTYQYDGDGNRVSMRTTVGDGAVQDAYLPGNPAGTRDGWEPQYKKRQLELYFTNDITMSIPQPLMATGAAGQNWKQSYVYGAGEERISMSYLVSGDKSNDWEPATGASAAGTAAGAPKTIFYLSDAQGSVIGLEGQDGSMSARYRYDEFGVAEAPEKFDLNWSGPDNLFGYTSLGYDYYSGYSHAQARDFDSSIGRFISEDTYEGQLIDPLSLNLYAYVKNNPLRYTDPSGNKPWEPYDVNELRLLLNDAIAKNLNKGSKLYQAYHDKIWERYGFASFLKTNRYNYLFGLLTGTSAYKNSAGNASWAREELIREFFGANLSGYIASMAMEGSTHVSTVKIKSPTVTDSEAVVTKGMGKTGTVWDSMKATQPLYEGTQIPKSFEISVGNQKVWVHGNATEHMYEDVAKVMKTPGIDPKLYSQQLLTDFQGSLQQATQNGIKYGELMNVGKWEFKFSPPREQGQLPALIHAQFNGWGK